MTTPPGPQQPPNGPQPQRPQSQGPQQPPSSGAYSPYRRPPFPGARPPRPPHVPQPFRRGGKALAVLVGLYALSWWFTVLGVGLALVIIAYGTWALLLVDWKGFTSFSGRLPWGTLSGWGKFWLVCGFVFVPELMLPLCLWFAVRDHLRATNSTLIGQVRGSWQGFMAASRRLQIGVASAALALVIAFCSLSGVASANSMWATPASTPTTGVSNSGQPTQNNGSSSSLSSSGSQVTPITAPTDTPTLAPTATVTPLPPAPTATPQAPTQPPSQSCYPLTNSGNCYEPGEYCRSADHNTTGIAGDGERITCTYNDGWRWEPY